MNYFSTLFRKELYMFRTDWYCIHSNWYLSYWLCWPL